MDKEERELMDVITQIRQYRKKVKLLNDLSKLVTSNGTSYFNIDYLKSLIGI